jgi:hypothetical protein
VRNSLQFSNNNIEVIGSEYPVSFIKKTLSNLIGLLRIILIAIAAGGQAVRPYLTFIPAKYLDLIEQKKWMLIIGSFFVGSMIQGALTSSGAFEVYCNNKLVNN